MKVHLTLLCATAGGAVFGDGRLSERGLREAGSAGVALRPYPLAVRAPSSRCTQMAEALGLETTLEPALRDFDYGEWRGRTVGDVAATDPHGLTAWLTDPDSAPHGGESVRQLCRRTADWLSSLPPDSGRALAITEPAVVRALLVLALSAPARACWHLDVPPLSAVSFTSRGGRWDARLDRVTLYESASSSPLEHGGPALVT